MESIEAYFARKRQELELLNSLLRNPLRVRSPGSIAEVVEQKFHLAAALKSEHVLQDWSMTETAWTHAGHPRSGPFEFQYDYQRADLEVKGPSFYGLDGDLRERTLYTASGMAAISALLMATAPVLTEADIFTLPNSYGETSEFIDAFARHLNRIELGPSFSQLADSRGRRPRILLLDSCTSAGAFEAILRCARVQLDLVLFDTTCFAGRSSRIRRVMIWAREAEIPIVLLRSHTKLDSLGVEYGRLGSVVFPDGPQHKPLLQGLLDETRNSVRLLGGAALPAHFPPYVGADAYRSLTDRRIAATLRNNRRSVRCFEAIPGSSAELHFVHGLYITLAPAADLDENQTRTLVAELCDDVARKRLPLRHAGSFGFDFGAAEWSMDRVRDRYVVRIAAADLPGSLWDQVVAAVAEWWSHYQRRSGADRSRRAG